MKKITLFFAAFLLLPFAYGANASSVSLQNGVSQPHGRKVTYDIPSHPTPVPLRTARVKETKDSPVIYGNLIYRGDWDRYLGGIYSMETTSEAIPEVLSQNGLYANGGGTLVPDDNVYVAGAYSTYPGSYGIYDPALIIYDCNTWDVIGYKDCSANAMSWDMCYNPADGKIYGSFPNDSDFSGVYFGTLDYKMGKSTPISALTLPYVALAAAWNGEMYGIEQTTGDLYKIRQNGERTLIGNTGLAPIYYQSATFDYTSGNLYWMACLDESSALFIVDTETAELSLVVDYPLLDEWVGIYTRTEYLPAEVPGAVEDAEIAFIGGETRGTVKFTMPSLCYGGTPLGNVKYNVYVDDELQVSSEVAPSTKVSMDIDSPEGLVKFMIEAVNDKGRGPRTVINRWVGYDTPSSVKGLTAVGDADTRTISWEAVTEGIHHGNIDISNLRYKVVRLPDNVTVCSDVTNTSIVDNDKLVKLAPYRYVVTANVDASKSEKEISNILVLGNPLTAPYNSDFDDIESLLLYVTEDGNKDGNIWTPYYDSGQYVFRYRYSEIGNFADDWLFTPPVKLEKGKVYGFEMNVGNVNNPERIEVKAGLAPSSDSMVFSVVNDFELMEDASRQAYFQPEEDGIYYFGFHAISEPYNFYLFLKGWSIGSAIVPTSPSIPDNLELTPGVKGDLSTEISFVAPATDCEASQITELTSITIVNLTTGKTVKTLNNPTPGEKVTIEDAEAQQGLNTYEVYASNSVGRGLSAFGKVWVGIDIPSRLSNFNWNLLDDGSARIYWDEVSSVGEHGGYVDPDNVDYRVIVHYPDFDILSLGKATEVTYSPISDITTPQVMVYFEGYSRNSAGYSEETRSHFGPVGIPYVLPYDESFSKGLIQNGPWGVDIISIDRAWMVNDGTHLSGLVSQDGDAGFLSIGGYGNAEGIVISPLVSLKDAYSPVLTFFASRPTDSTQFTVRISTNNGKIWEELGEIEVSEGVEWKKYEFSLSDYVGKNICLSFYGCVPFNTFECGLDNISITDGRSDKGLLESGRNQMIRVRTEGEILEINDVYGEVAIYSIDGYRIAEMNIDGDASITLPHGIYFVCHKNSRVKVRM